MQFTTLAVGLLASLSSVTAVALEKRVDHYGIATVNPNPSNGLGSCGNPFRDSQYKVRSFPKTKRRDTLTDGGFKVALSNYWMKNQSPSSYCGRKIVLTNTGPSGDNSVGGKGNSVVVTVDDTCPGCDENHLDLSVAAWNKLTNGHGYSQVGITWHFCNANGQC
ncbi:uncharacterized protein K489DRAFT_410950 [Dissoconium aciculare CBS 342.82]|uniref:RlpA-like protein double-psi beta-barrel domain-containing protein n=1 Tax=Dissoconium aciculare CBS 342.82 TaxID=1314786 RepID=A0A6J3M0D2_9PEZI|nr:uncharacterized protein K489DRAFT_410950 [Dissoconium aciculare CBS 342.82]KAF1821481.1 hypothetical protein K489DRAFT_410950 [Dissoconium aciculare CBS 342.82]